VVNRCTIQYRFLCSAFETPVALSSVLRDTANTPPSPFFSFPRCACFGQPGSCHTFRLFFSIRCELLKFHLNDLRPIFFPRVAYPTRTAVVGFPLQPLSPSDTARDIKTADCFSNRPSWRTNRHMMAKGRFFYPSPQFLKEATSGRPPRRRQHD